MANLMELAGALQPIAKSFLLRCNEEFKTEITITYRGAADQVKARNSGLSKAGAGQSPHNCTLADGTPAARAFDFAVYDDDGEYITDGANQRYATAALIALDEGQKAGLILKWGGAWTVETDGCGPDFDHIQIQDWKTVTL